jgi:hypothetical protein
MMLSVYIQNIKVDRSLNNETNQAAETILTADVSGWSIVWETNRHVCQWDWLSGCCYVISGLSPVSMTMSWRGTCHVWQHHTKLPIPPFLWITWLNVFRSECSWESS